jgi:hypothetical protein
MGGDYRCDVRDGARASRPAAQGAASIAFRTVSGAVKIWSGLAS